MIEIRLIPGNEFQRVRAASLPRFEKLRLLSDMCRANTLATVKRAGSGHLGSSFSSLDIVAALYFAEMNIGEKGINDPNRDIYFSSKGHDVPGHYAVLFALGIISKEQFINLRRLGGTHGHPDVSVPGIEANSGSLGMGISKAKGMAWAKTARDLSGRVIVMTGDGELQEGQIWESLQTTVHQKIHNLLVIVDCNKIQSDKVVEQIINLGDLETKFSIFGWHVERCDGHDFEALENVFAKLNRITDKPKVLIADTIKGKGISFMEGPTALKDGNGLYRWHAGAPENEYFEAGYQELIARINQGLQSVGLAALNTEIIETIEKHRVRLKDTAEKVVDAYGEALLELGSARDDIVVLDGDLSADCGVRPFENSFPKRFIENGIAEQDMVSMAGGLALQGFLPIVNSFGVFLASRANEQIYNNATENTKIIYVCHYAGIIPAGPGKSHQSVRDISLLGALPNFSILEPCNGLETKQALEWCVKEAETNCMIRLVISPSPRSIRLPENYKLSLGKGAILSEGSGAVLFAYGPVLLNEALLASEGLKEKNVNLKVINFPWINRINMDWLEDTIGDSDTIFVMDNHSTSGGLGDFLLNSMMSSDTLRTKRLIKYAIEEFPACGTPKEVLAYHKLDGNSLITRILGAMS
ncbi:MAG: 1-deoxy-D-xylulose-5-phosphate synthase N-terminal domain-containing protein [Desulfobacterales bacterium]|jgi:transketolase